MRYWIAVACKEHVMRGVQGALLKFVTESQDRLSSCVATIGFSTIHPQCALVRKSLVELYCNWKGR